MRRNATAGAEVLNRLTQIAGARLMGTEPEEEAGTPADPKSIVMAAQAIAQRMRARARSTAA
jgi:hypothetical protein